MKYILTHDIQYTPRTGLTLTYQDAHGQQRTVSITWKQYGLRLSHPQRFNHNVLKPLRDELGGQSTDSQSVGSDCRRLDRGKDDYGCK